MNHGRNVARHVRMLGLAAMAVLAFGAVTAASASAVEFEPTDGLGFPVPFTSTSGAGELIVTKEVFPTHPGEVESTVTCTSDTNLGKITNATEGQARVRFKGCKASLLNCTTSGAGTGEIVTSVLHTYLVPLREEKFGILFLPEGANPKTEYSTGVFATFTCGGIFSIQVTGGVIGQITSPAKGTASSTFTLNFAKVEPSANKFQQEFIKTAETGEPEFLLGSSKSGGTRHTAIEVTTDTATLCKSTTEIKAGEGTCSAEHREGKFK